MARKTGGRTVTFEKNIIIRACGSAVGKKEGEGPLGDEFDNVYNDELMGEDSFEKAESSLQKIALTTALKKAGLRPAQVDLLFAGDLLNQCIGSTFGLREFGVPFIGMYGACSTFSLSLIAAANFIESGAAERAAAVTSSHFCSAERQFRFPLEYGGQRTPTAQWTVTGAGAAVLEHGDSGVRVLAATSGKIIDLGVRDMNNMGAAMAPAAADTIAAFLRDTGAAPRDFDAIVTGDLGRVGTRLLHDLLFREGVDIGNVHRDCGLLIFDNTSQDVHAGGSGCGCSASVFSAHIFPRLRSGEYKNVLFCATGALMSPTSSMQGESIPGIAHLVHIAAQ